MPSDVSESISPLPSLAGHQNQQVGLDNQQGGGYNTLIIERGLFAAQQKKFKLLYFII